MTHFWLKTSRPYHSVNCHVNQGAPIFAILLISISLFLETGMFQPSTRSSFVPTFRRDGIQSRLEFAYQTRTESSWSELRPRFPSTSWLLHLPHYPFHQCLQMVGVPYHGRVDIPRGEYEALRTSPLQVCGHSPTLEEWRWDHVFRHSRTLACK